MKQFSSEIFISCQFYRTLTDKYESGKHELSKHTHTVYNELSISEIELLTSRAALEHKVKGIKIIEY